VAVLSRQLVPERCDSCQAAFFASIDRSDLVQVIQLKKSETDFLRVKPNN
jgi:hypothetical protein